MQRLIAGASVSLAMLLTVIVAVQWNEGTRNQESNRSTSNTKTIRIQRPGFPEIILQRGVHGGWSITEPCVLPANAQRLQPLLDALTPAAISYAATEVDRDTAGLTQPAAVVFLDEVANLLGQVDLSGERRYVQRGERISFAPEWVLSLVNGGLSALASLNVFPDTLDTIASGPIAGGDVESSMPDIPDPVELATWQALTAQQIVTWPLEDEESAIRTTQLSAQVKGRWTDFSLNTYARFAAIHFENAACAYILPLSSLPDSTQP
jgi:hypothetical protein